MVADLNQGETVLDLGSGGGIDVILSAKRVGATGMAFGLDMTDEMLALARAERAALLRQLAERTFPDRTNLRDPCPDEHPLWVECTVDRRGVHRRRERPLARG